MKKIIFYNNKGGVAKTMTCVNLACIYAEQGIKTLVVDIDPQANSTHFLLKDKSVYMGKTMKNLMDPNDDSVDSIDDVIYQSDISPNLFIAPAEPDLDESEMAMMFSTFVQATSEPKFILANYLSKMKADFDLVLMDTHPSKKRLLNINGLVAADAIGVPVDSDPESLEGLNPIVDIVKSCLPLNPSLKIIGVIYTKSRNTNADFRAMSFLAETMMDDKGNSLLFDTAIPLRTKAVESRWTKVPLVTYAPNDDCTIAYKELAKELEERMGGFKDA